MGNIIRPDLVEILGKEHEDTQELLKTLRKNKTMAMILLRRIDYFKSFFLLAGVDEENAGYWMEIAEKCDRLCKDLWKQKIEDSVAFEELLKMLEMPMPEKPLTAEELREKMISSLQGKGMNEILRSIKNALDADEWKVFLAEDKASEDAYRKLKAMYSQRCTEQFLQKLDNEYRNFTQKKILLGGVRDVSEYVVKWCLDGATENLVKKEEGYPLNESYWTDPYDAERARLLKNSYFYTASDLLGYWDEYLKQERGRTLKNSYGYEKCKPGLEREEKKFKVLEEAYSLLTTYRRKLADGTWFELWENGEAKGVERTALFFLAAGKVSVDRTDFDRIWTAESEIKYSDTEYMELGRWYWNQGVRLADYTGLVASDENKCNVGKFRIPKPAEEAVRYILNELLKWKKMDKSITEYIKKCACSHVFESRIRDAKERLESCESHLRKRQAELDAAFNISGPWKLVYREKKVELCLNKKKKQGYYLVTCEKPMFSGISADKYYEVLKSVVMHHRYRKWIRIFEHVTFGWNRKNQKRYVRLYKSVDGVRRMKEICESFVNKRRRLHEKMRTECKKIRNRETALMELAPGKYAEAQKEGLFQYWEGQWSAVNQAYSDFLREKTEWEKEESAHWEKEFDGFKKSCETYRERMSRTFNDCYCLLELKKVKRKKERGKKLCGWKKRREAHRRSRKERRPRKAKVR